MDYLGKQTTTTFSYLPDMLVLYEMEDLEWL